MFSQHQIIGNLGADPEMKFLQSGKAVTNFSVAVNERWTNPDGSHSERTTWYRVAAWGRLAEVTNTYLAKGRRVMVVGSRLETEAYVNEQGEPVATLKLTAQTVKFLDPTNGENDTPVDEEEIDF